MRNRLEGAAYVTETRSWSAYHKRCHTKLYKRGKNINRTKETALQSQKTTAEDYMSAPEFTFVHDKKRITRLHQSTSADISEEYTNEENYMIEAEYHLTEGMNATATRVRTTDNRQQEADVHPRESDKRESNHNQ